MNIQQEQSLETIFKENQNKGIAIAITGCWGVGKTYSWDRFIKKRAEHEENEIKQKPSYERKNKDKIFSKKYAYVSLFGIESLSDLKAAISTNMSSNYFNKESSQNFEIPTFIKKGLSALRDVKMSGSSEGFSINSSAKIFEAVLYSQVKDAIICFDDFERMSKKLDIKDVMGLANQLKLERNCQVILILDETKNEDDNQKKYAEYKEKLIDETIKINSVEPLLREKTKELDEPLVDLMVNFANELEIHNFRFLKKVIKLYKKFREQLPQEVADSTKKIILIRVLQGYFIEDFGKKYEFEWEDTRLVIEEKQVGWSERKRKTYQTLKSLDYKLIHSDEWFMEFKKWFDQKGEPNWTLLHDLANSTMISEENNRIKDDFHKLCEEFWGLQAQKDFPKKFYKATKAVVGLETIHNLSFALKILELFNEDITSLEKNICEWIKEQKNKDRQSFYNIQDDEIRPIFKELILNHRPSKEELPQLIDAIFQIYVNEAWNDRDELAIEYASKEQWEKLLFEEINIDVRFQNINSSYLIKKIFDRKRNLLVEHKIREFITEIYKEKAEKEPFYAEYMNYLISRLDN
ncbi:KAP family P-loop domain protein [Acinetobacter sp. YH12239]|uniref:KAP family P-loop domain protein n=1 Tax=Acinetobacter sp. YH12239 TaxID=2601166 RepID=UPI0015D0E24F|nr:KAP family P-loop domain protein [Acinetobacter sp. YH12239]